MLANALVFVVKGTPLLTLWVVAAGLWGVACAGFSTRARLRRRQVAGGMLIAGASVAASAGLFALRRCAWPSSAVAVNGPLAFVWWPCHRVRLWLFVGWHLLSVAGMARLEH